MKSIIYLLPLFSLLSCKPHEQKINPRDIKGNWVSSEAVMFTSLDVSDSSIRVGNRADTIFTVRYSISDDTLITYASFTNHQSKNRIVLLTRDTLVLDGIMDVKETRHYSRRISTDIDLFNFPSENFLINTRFIGNVAIGMSMSEVRRNYHDCEFATIPAWHYCIDGGGDGVVISKDKQELLFVCPTYGIDSVCLIMALSPRFHTSDGLTPSSSIGQLLKLHPGMKIYNNMMCAGEYFKDDTNRMIYEFASGDSSLVGVYKPGEFATTQFDTTRKIDRIWISKFYN